MQGRLEDYDPRSTDVWAAGVMLVVSLLGAFPFDHTQMHNPGTTDDELDLWCALTAVAYWIQKHSYLSIKYLHSLQTAAHMLLREC